jgi:hypothetical protein
VNCGQAIHVRDAYGAYVVRFIAQCEDRWLLISRGFEPRNGYVLSSWRYVLRELIAMAVPAKLTEHVKSAESTGTQVFINVPLTYPLSAQSFADLLDVPVDEVRAVLEDAAVRWHEV